MVALVLGVMLRRRIPGRFFRRGLCGRAAVARGLLMRMRGVAFVARVIVAFIVVV